MDNHLLWNFFCKRSVHYPLGELDNKWASLFVWHWDCEMAQPCSINNSVWHLKPCLQSESNDLLCVTQILSHWKDCKEPVKKSKMSQNANILDALFEMPQDEAFFETGKNTKWKFPYGQKSVTFLKILLYLIWSMYFLI